MDNCSDSSRRSRKSSGTFILALPGTNPGSVGSSTCNTHGLLLRKSNTKLPSSSLIAVALIFSGGRSAPMGILRPNSICLIAIPTSGLPLGSLHVPEIRHSCGVAQPARKMIPTNKGMRSAAARRRVPAERGVDDLLIISESFVDITARRQHEPHDVTMHD